MKNESSTVARSNERNEQYEAYKSEAEEGKTVESIKTVERLVKNVIYPKIKFLSDNEDDYDQPDFASNGSSKQTVAICDCILGCLDKKHYTIKQKVHWWVAYRKVIRRKISKLRQSDVRALQVFFVEGNVDI